MSLLLKLLGGSAGTYIAIALLAIFGGMGATIWVEHATIGELRAQLAEEKADLTKVTDANKTDQGVIASLQHALDVWKDSATKAAAAGAAAADELAKSKAALDAANAQLTVREKADNVLPDCQKLESLDIAAVCPGHAAAERMHSSDANRVQGPGSKGAGPDTRTH